MSLQDKQDTYFKQYCLDMIQHHIKSVELILQDTCIQYYKDLKQEQVLCYLQDRNNLMNKGQLELQDQHFNNMILEGIRDSQLSQLLQTTASRFQLDNLRELKLISDSIFLKDKCLLSLFLNLMVLRLLYLQHNSNQQYMHLRQLQENLNDNKIQLYRDFQ